jgi:hypothetical protein
MNLLPKNNNILGSLGQLTQGTDIGTVMKVLNAVNNINKLKQDINSIPGLFNKTLDILSDQTVNLTASVLKELSGK